MERPEHAQGRSRTDDLAEREEDATSKDTLKDVSEKEKSTGSTEQRDDKPPPSPDGVPDRARELKDSQMSDTL